MDLSQIVGSVLKVADSSIAKPQTPLEQILSGLGLDMKQISGWLSTGSTVMGLAKGLGLFGGKEDNSALKTDLLGQLTQRITSATNIQKQDASAAGNMTDLIGLLNQATKFVKAS